MKNTFSFLFLIYLIFLSGCLHEPSGISSIRIAELQVNFLHEPLGFDQSKPTFSWKMTSSGRGQYQTAYQILLASSSRLLQDDQGDIWDSGKIEDERSVQYYNGDVPLESGRRYYYQVRIWDSDGNVSPYSEYSWFETGKLKPGDWQAHWISQQPDLPGMPELLPAPYHRKEFEIPGEISKARLYISGLGYYKAYINGRKVGDHELDPAFTRYDRRVKYVVYDIGDMIRQGKNCIGVVLGNGWYNQHTRSAWDLDSAAWRDDPSLLAQLEITMEDGLRKIICTDKTWRAGQGPIIFDGIRNGEHYDARREIPGWNEIGFDDSDWEEAFEVEGPFGILSAQLMPPIKIIREIEPVNVTEPEEGLYLIDFGENITGRVRIAMKGNHGQEIILRYSERIHPDGTLDQKELARFIWTGETQTDHYIFKGGGKETWESSFVYHGFQYVQVEGLDHAPAAEEMKAVVLHTDLKRAGSFQCSNDMFNRIQQNLLNSFLGNYHGYPTDCPHREKIGWSGDAQLVSATGLYNFEMIPAYLKWMDDFADEQRPDGKVPAIIPTSGWGYEFGRGPQRKYGYGPHWDGAYLNIPWDMYQFTADRSILERYYDGWKAYMTYLEGSARDYILEYGIDDHKPVTTVTGGDFLSTAYFFDFSKKMAKISWLLGKVEDQEYYDQLSGKIYHAFNDRFFNEEKGIYGNGGQTSMSLALYLDLVPEGERERVIKNLLEEIREKNFHIDAGVVGARMLIKALTRLGYSDIMYQIANQPDFPGWGYWVNQGASTLWQTWKGDMSLNHIMFGSIGEWFYSVLGGIQIDPGLPGFGKFILKPEVMDSLEWVDCSFESCFGTIISKWKRHGDRLSWQIEIPVNSSATVYFPLRYGTQITESGKPVSDYPEIEIIGKKEDHLLLALPSGRYNFETD